MAMPGMAADGAELNHQIHAAAIGQRNVADEKIESVAHRGFQGGADIVGGGDEMSASNEQTFESITGVLMIVHQQDA